MKPISTVGSSVLKIKPPHAHIPGQKRGAGPGEEPREDGGVAAGPLHKRQDHLREDRQGARGQDQPDPEQHPRL